MYLTMDERQVLLAKNQSLSQHIAVLQDEEKQRELELQELRGSLNTLEVQCHSVDEGNYEEWGPEQIFKWIINLDHGRLSKYEKALEQTLKEEEAHGLLLRSVDGGDLRGWGIVNLCDRKFVQQHIERLVAKDITTAEPILTLNHTKVLSFETDEGVLNAEPHE